MKTGLIIYSLNLDKLVSFYQEAFGFSVTEREDGFALLRHDSFELVILETDISKSQDNQSRRTISPREATPADIFL